MYGNYLHIYNLPHNINPRPTSRARCKYNNNFKKCLLQSVSALNLTHALSVDLIPAVTPPMTNGRLSKAVCFCLNLLVDYFAKMTRVTKKRLREEIAQNNGE